MNEISKIELSNGTYTIKDATAREKVSEVERNMMTSEKTNTLIKEWFDSNKDKIGSNVSEEQISSAVNSYLEENPLGIDTDNTLSVEGKPADAKAVGELVNIEFKNTKQDITTSIDWNRTEYLLKTNGNTVANTSGMHSDFIACNLNDIYYITAIATGETCCIATYDNNKNFIKAYGINEVLNDYKFVPLENEAYIRFGSFDSTYHSNPVIKICKETTLKRKVTDVIAELIAFTQKPSSNVLENKKWIACGDSFTEGDFSGYVDSNGNTGRNSDAFDKEANLYKTYPYWISKRNNMQLKNIAKCGADFTNVENASNPFSATSSTSNYTKIDADADYVTLCFGLNETGLTDEQIGSKTDTSNATLWGAYNIVLESIMKKNPFTKIGIIIPDAWMNVKYHDAVVEIANFWGVPFLDLKDGTSMNIGGTLRECSQKAKNIRDNAFKVTATNGHPNVQAHKYRSTIIENFLRSL